MTATRQELLEVLHIAHDTSVKGAGVSLQDALRRARYHERRPSFGAADLRPLLEADPELLDTWFGYSADKRTDGGWYVLASGEIGQVVHPDSRRRFVSPEQAVAEYVVLELDFWASLIPDP